jgi:hypothetical protein
MSAMLKSIPTTSSREISGSGSAMLTVQVVLPTHGPPTDHRAALERALDA